MWYRLSQFFVSIINLVDQIAKMVDQLVLPGAGPITTDGDVIVIEDDEEIMETGVEAGSAVEIIEISDIDDSSEVIEIDDTEEELFELTEFGSLHEHRGQHISTGTTCDKCAKLLDLDQNTEEHLGENHQNCKKCNDIS